MAKKPKDRYTAVHTGKSTTVSFPEEDQVDPRRKVADRVNKRLTRKQELFVKELVSKDGQITMRQAAINAGYPEKSAHVRASEMTNPQKFPHVCRAIREYRQELDQKYGVEYQRHLRDLQIIRDAALESGAFSAAVQAEYRRGQAQGDIYVNKTEIRHGSIDQMSKEEVMKALEELRQQYQPLTHDGGADAPRNRSTARERLSQVIDGESEEIHGHIDERETQEASERS